MSNVLLTNCNQCRRYRYTTLVAHGGVWQYLCGRCLRGDRPAPTFIDNDAARLATAPVTPPPPPLERVAHPATKAPEYKCYRVVRHYRHNGVTYFEDIGAFKTPLAAVEMLTREIGRARILDPNGKVWADNWRAIEDRTGSPP